jgi:hypothetical protein
LHIFLSPEGDQGDKHQGGRRDENWRIDQCLAVALVLLPGMVARLFTDESTGYGDILIDIANGADSMIAVGNCQGDTTC